MNKLCAIFFYLLFVFGACDIYKQDNFQQRYMVESYLVVNRTLPQVRISTIVPIDQKYDIKDAAVNNADVTIQLLNKAGDIEENYPYIQQSSGVYIPTQSHKVLPSRKYRLQVKIGSSEDEISATTLVPGEFKHLGEVVDSIAYQDPRQIKITTERSTYPGRQAFFIFNVNALKPKKQNLTPFYDDLVNNRNGDIKNYYTNSSGIVNEENYDLNKDGTLTLRVPWLAVAFFGENNIVINAIDDNMYDFFRSQDVQTGGSTLAPGELQNVIYHVKGGIGIFGSLATDTVKVFIKRINEMASNK